MKYIEIKAPAKINIGLSVISKRPDGYHNLSTLFYPINDLFDLMTFELSESFSFSCSNSNLPQDEGNLVVKAKNLLENITGKKLSVKINLQKFIPSQAGLGGGSSDAAATLISLNELFLLGLNNEKLNTLALELGSDVPFFIRALPAVGSSRGEILDMIDLEIENPILIVNPGINISTHDAFHNIKPKNSILNYSHIIRDGRLDFDFMRNNIGNDFEEYAFREYPEIAAIKNQLYNEGAVFSLMSGSGSSVYGIFENIELAEKTKNNFPKNYFCYLSTPHH
ncbi:MAG: 4-(cytidine 5'-diphospho)-2-C-methyl-D-erythritol kinase [Ignavibacteriae bacterium HGW-Ignavibacteriae-3]|nr:MAG: 4-(cytidine 5'-diphospho)-2-C-methyl-D-erythritol kinase [Ignavibacteriae bacterium HGW-Ignavibacteriae-3]